MHISTYSVQQNIQCTTVHCKAGSFPTNNTYMYINSYNWTATTTTWCTSSLHSWWDLEHECLVFEAQPQMLGTRTLATLAKDEDLNLTTVSHTFTLPETKHSSAKSSLLCRQQCNLFTGIYNMLQVFIIKFYMYIPRSRLWLHVKCQLKDNFKKGYLA